MANNNYYFVYILSNRHNTVFYTGITNDLIRRIYEHKKKIIKGFTARYNCDKLLWYEQYFDPDNAILAEKKIKRWKRKYKINTINEMNPEWIDLYDSFIPLSGEETPE